MADINSYGIKFSEERYASKDDVKKHFNMSSVDQFWNLILDYRKGLTSTFELPSIDRVKYSLVFTKSISNRINDVERKLCKAYMEYINLSSRAKNIFEHKRYERIASSILASNNIAMSPTFVDSLIDKNISTIPSDYLVLANYLESLNYIKSYDGSKISLYDLNSIYSILESGTKSSLGKDDIIFRKLECEEPHYYNQGYVYKSALVDRIPDMMNSLIEFVNDENHYALVRAISCLFYVDYVMPYDYLRSEDSVLNFKLVLARNDFSLFSTYLNIENLYFAKNAKLDQVKELVQKTMDLTYFFDFILDYLKEDIATIFDDLATSKKDEMVFESKEEVKEEIKEDDNRLSEETIPQKKEEYVTLYGQVDVALPIFPQGLKEDDVERIVIDLMETYPTLKRTQAHFYAKHCTIGRTYTIQQFKNEEGTSYETARTSMDALAMLGFYEKTNLRNKFVYKPIPRR